MPHCIIEYSQALADTVGTQALIAAVHAGAAQSGLFEPVDIKTRALAYADYRVGDAKSDFVHVTARILSGRSDEQKTQLTHLILGELEGITPAPISLTVEVCDIHRASHAKTVRG